MLKIRQQEALQREFQKAMRLAAAPCPCKSGKKFGECCLPKHKPEARQAGLKREV